MPPPYRAHVFICTNRRPDGSPKGCCASKGSEELKLEFKKELDAAHLNDIRANTSGCLDACERGPSVVVYPQGVWYGGVTKADVKEIVEKHLRDGEVVQRLVMAPFERKKGFATASVAGPTAVPSGQPDEQRSPPEKKGT